MSKAPPKTEVAGLLTLCYEITRAINRTEIVRSFEKAPLEILGVKRIILTLKLPWAEEEKYVISPGNPLPLDSPGETKEECCFNIERDGRSLGSITVLFSRADGDTPPQKKIWQLIANILATSLTRIWREKELLQQLKAREEELRETIEELKRNREVQATFMKRVAHELRTPLHSIIGFSQILEEEKEKLPENTQNCLQLILDKSKEMKETIEDITLLWELKREEESLKIREVDVSQLVNEVLETLSSSILEKGLEVRKDIEVSKIKVDEERMKRAIHHLVSNAVKFTPEKGKIGIKVESVPGGTKLSVWDTGIGIPPEHMEEIWEPFKQLEDPLTRKYQGMGVGLPLVRKIVTAHGGDIWVEKGKGGKGACFVMIIPQPPKETGGEDGRTN